MLYRDAWSLEIHGLVQGVGFRPYAAGVAEELSIGGEVCNLGGIVKIILDTDDDKVLEEYLQHLSSRFPKNGDNGRIEKVIRRKVQVVSGIDDEEWRLVQQRADRDNREVYRLSNGFNIVESREGSDIMRLLPADISICKKCESELLDASNRRYRHPFISCVSCGPRFTIMKRTPYDRESITMDIFKMCPECAGEYKEKNNRRRHAQTIACNSCGPRLKLYSEAALLDGEDALNAAVKSLNNGEIGAVKDIGGFHFAFRADNEEAAKRLRIFKNRENKPFAVMFSDIGEVRRICNVSKKEEELLTSMSRPIVLLERREDNLESCKLASGVCGGSDRIGAMLPSNPLQILLVRETGPLVMTSGNRGGEPIIIEDEKVISYMESKGCPDFVLTHDRAVLTPLDDSIFQVSRFYISKSEQETLKEIVQTVRRARGFVPEPIFIEEDELRGGSVSSQEEEARVRNILAAGGDMKAVFALSSGNAVYLSGHFGDLDNLDAAEARRRSISHMEELLNIHSVAETVCDLHPGYISSKEVEDLAGGGNHINIYKVQHHHAHIASVIAEYSLKGRVLGLAYDGTGYGTDGTVWGSEMLLYDGESFKRLGSLMPVRLLGGDSSSRDAVMTLYSYLHEARKRSFLTEDDISDILLHQPDGDVNSAKEYDRNNKQACETKRLLYSSAIENNINTIMSTSMGRLFDAVAALLGICIENTYEGECAAKLETAAHSAERQHNTTLDKNIVIDIKEVDGRLQGDAVKLLSEMYYNLKAGRSREYLALQFHLAIADMAVKMLRRCLADDRDISAIALGGGTFYNRILVRELYRNLTPTGVPVYINNKVPCGDGGIALGQTWIAMKNPR